MSCFANRRKAVIILAALILSWMAAPAEGKRRWIKVTSPNFEMFTSAGEGAAKQTIKNFEQIRSFFIEMTPSKAAPPLPVRIVAFRSQKEYQPYRLREVADAYYSPGHDRDYIVMGRISSKTRPVAIHEYVHLLVRHSGLEFPVWLNEGVADLYSTLMPYGGKLVIGAALPGRYQLLQRKKWLPLDELTSVDHDSPHYNEKNRRGLFYAQSWALTHMLYLSEAYRSKLADLLSGVARGADAASAFQHVYGKSLEQVEKDLRLYMRRDRLVAAVFDAKLEKLAEKPQVQPATELETGMILANLLARTKKRDQARKMYRELAKQHPDAPEVPEALGYLARYSGDQEAARGHFARAVELGSANPRLYYDYARSLYSSGAEETRVEPLLRKALKLNSDYQEARFLLAFVLYNQEKFAQALASFGLLKSVKAERAFPFFRAVAYSNYKLGRKEQARKAVERARKYAQSPTDVSRLEELVRWMDWADEAEKAAKAPAAAAIDDLEEHRTNARPRLERAVKPADRPGETEEEGVELVLTGPSTESLEGTLTQLDCLGDTARLHVTHEDEETILAILDPRRVVIKGTGGAVDLNCGPQEEAVNIEFEPSEDAPLETAGIVTTIEFR